MSSHHGHPHAGATHHHHHPTPAGDYGRAFFIAVALNSGFVVAEFIFGFLANSTALMADAGHNLSDVLGLLLAWGASALARRAPAGRYTYGLRSSSILAAMTNAVLLLLACGAIAWEAVQRIADPPAVAGVTVMAVAGLGIVVNGISAWLFMGGARHDLNIRGAYLHLAADAAVSLGVVLAGAAIVWTGWRWLDPAISLVIVAIVVFGTWHLLRDAVRLALDAVPAHIDPVAVEAWLSGQPGVAEVHDLHIWGMSTTESALTAHLVMPAGHPGDDFVDRLGDTLHHRFAIQHSTIQVEREARDHQCALHPAAD